MRSIALRVGIIAAIAGGAFLLRDFLPGNAGDLAVGDCFDPPTTGDTVDDVPHHPCTEAHGGEVIFVGNYEPTAEAFPTEDQWLAFLGARCVPAFAVYTGFDYTSEEASNLDFAAYRPTTDGWSDGDRRVICYVVNIDGSQFSSPVGKSQ